jgi:SPP1 gp7 family putative phage head morphogenesis protein
VPLSARQVAELRVRRALTLVRSRRSTRRQQRPPLARWPSGARLAYFAALKAVVTDLRVGVERELLPKLPRLLALVEADKPRQDGADLRLDATDDLKKQLTAIADVVDNVIPEKRAKDIAEKAGAQVSTFNKDEINGQMRSTLGIDLLHGEPYLAQQLEMFAEDNARLITSMAATALDDVAGIVMRGARAGTQVGDVADEIRKRFDVVEGKAGLIARDQVGKLNGELTQLRHQAVGVTEYEWSTSRDERVRSRHAELEGTEHRWDDPPVVDEKTGRKAHPGQDFQCRCTAIPKVDDLLAALGLDEAGAGGPPSKPPVAPPPAPPVPLSQPPTSAAPPAPPEPPQPPEPPSSPEPSSEPPRKPRKLTNREVADHVQQLPTLPRDELLQRQTDKFEQRVRSSSLDLMPRQKEAIEYWGGDFGYKEIAKYETKTFESGTPPAVIARAERETKALWEAIADAEHAAAERGDAPIQLYRGTANDETDYVSHLLTEDTLDLTRMTSWSTDPMACLEFTAEGRHKVFLEVQTSKGLPVVIWAPQTHEAETILGKARYRIVRRQSVLRSDGSHGYLLVTLEEMDPQ